MSFLYKPVNFLSFSLAGFMVLAASRAEGSPSESGLSFTPGEELTYNVMVQHQWRSPQFQSLPNWKGKLKVWPITQSNDGTLLLRAREAMMDATPGITYESGSDGDDFWAQFSIDPQGNQGSFRFMPRSDETSWIRLAFPADEIGTIAGPTWKKVSATGFESIYRFAAGSSPRDPKWVIDVDSHCQQYDALGIQEHEHFTYDREVGLITDWRRDLDYRQGAWTHETDTAQFLDSRHLSPSEIAELARDSQLYIDTLVELEALASPADFKGDVDNYRKRIDLFIARIKNLPKSILNPPHRNNLSSMWSYQESKQNWQDRVNEAEQVTKAESALLNKPSPDWTANDVTGQSHSLKDYRGKIILLDFWSCNCGPCIVAMPYLNQLEDVYAHQPVVFLGMNTGDSPDDIKRKMEQMRLKNTQILFGGKAGIYNVSAIPVLIIIDQQGIVRFHNIGWDDTEKRPLRARIDQLLDKMH
jgi:thiol-disulfide isomerase/thioredoxin